ncbi:unnamed protein product [Rotaria sp. Silwood2]|nr:unnamed protein product [Rotaria sp. Silwood2]CAF3007245.1 unnamed protein product [Rotaria sp. Silwood2]CAF3359390.1 unnamed protein product [Rotaria sp. Silwood2]CAF4029123.1 unnamed protein product [Rotaria sp. Silwood2]CAF4229045.1 unnamed protein product [Rotaria sp. Silwood2]
MSLNALLLYLVTMSVGGAGAYTETSDAMAARLVSERGVYITFSQGNDGGQGLQTSGNPAISSGAMAIASIDNSHTPQSYLSTPDGEKIFYSAGANSGGWHSTVNSIIVVNDPQATANDGCNGPTKSVAGAVVLYAYNIGDLCNSAVRCNKAAAAGATGCLLYNVGAISGSSAIPSGSISLTNGQHIIAITTENLSAMFTFTNKVALAPVVISSLLLIYLKSTAGTPSQFSSLGLTGDLLFKPQISGIGGYVYSTISSFAATTQKLSTTYASYSGTSMACPYVAGYV